MWRTSPRTTRGCRRVLDGSHGGSSGTHQFLPSVRQDDDGSRRLPYRLGRAFTDDTLNGHAFPYAVGGSSSRSDLAMK